MASSCSDCRAVFPLARTGRGPVKRRAAERPSRSQGILLSSDVIPAQHFPALHTLRGEVFRSRVDWYQSIDALRQFRASAMVPSHGVPVVGAAAVDEVMRNYRDAIQYVHDQTIRGMNTGPTHRKGATRGGAHGRAGPCADRRTAVFRRR